MNIEEINKKLLRIEYFVIIFGFGIALLLIYFAESMDIVDSLKYIITIMISIVIIILTGCICILIEQRVGYYECKKCKNRYVPTYMHTFFAPHLNRTRYMKCPKCNEKSWQKKVLSK